MPNIVPLHDYVVVELVAAKKVNKAGLIIDSARSAQDTPVLKVIEAGPGLYGEGNVKVPLAVKKGDYVLINADAMMIRFEETNYFVVKERNIVAILPNY